MNQLIEEIKAIAASAKQTLDEIEESQIQVNPALPIPPAIQEKLHDTAVL